MSFRNVRCMRYIDLFISEHSLSSTRIKEADLSIRLYKVSTVDFLLKCNSKHHLIIVSYVLNNIFITSLPFDDHWPNFIGLTWFALLMIRQIISKAKQ